VAVSSGTAALEIAIKALDIKKNDEVLIPNFTIISNALAVIRQQARPVLIDCNLKDWNIKIEDIEKNISKKTKAIIITHIYSFPNEMQKIFKICKKYNPKTSIKVTDDKTPNLGYSLSNKKLLGTGFKFFYSLEESISTMIKQWSYKQNNYDLEYKSRGEKEFIDKRGKISNYELTEPINLIGYIESIKGSMRANHYHPVQEQKFF